MQTVVTGHAECLLPGGEALVRCAGQSLLVSNAIPGDAVQCHIEGKRRGALRGRVEALLDASGMRGHAPCDVADACGGCALQFLDPVHHATIKSAWVRDAFSTFMDTGSAWVPIREGPRYGRRRRARWWRGHDSKGVFLGFRARNSHASVRTSACPMVCPEIDALRLHIQNHLPDAVESVRMTLLADGIHVVFEGGNISDAGIDRHLTSMLDNVDVGIAVVSWRGAISTVVPLLHPVKALHDIAPAADTFIQLSVGPDDFIQGNATGNAEIVRQVQEWAGSPRFVADLFCGMGNLSLPLAYATGAKVRGGDACASSIRQANVNARTHDLKARYVSINLFEPFDLSSFSGADVLILDPPRKGAKRICRNIGALLPASIIMVNCDIASGARDAAELHKLGYRLRALRAFDLFPWTGHVEAMSLWRR